MKTERINGEREKVMSKILIVEDEEAIADLEKDYLELSDFEVTIENTGDKGLETAMAGEFDLVILDLMLPGVTGETLLQQIQDIGDIPVIVISAKVGIDDKVEALLGGAADYITKPFAVRELLARITVQLRKRDLSARAGQTDGPDSCQEDQRLTVGDLSLDLVLREVSSQKAQDKNAAVRLTRTESAILRLLMQNAGQVFSKAAILDCISADTPDCTDSSLKQHISNLRKKLAGIGEADCIEAVWGIGFRLKSLPNLY